MEVKKKIGYLPETPPLYPEMEVHEYLHFVAQLKRAPLSIADRVRAIPGVAAVEPGSEFVADVGDQRQLLLVQELGDLLDQPGLADLIGDFREDDRATVVLAFFDVRLAAHHDRTAPGGVGAADAGLTKDQAAGRKVRTLHMLHQPF